MPWLNQTFCQYFSPLDCDESFYKKHTKKGNICALKQHTMTMLVSGLSQAHLSVPNLRARVLIENAESGIAKMIKLNNKNANNLSSAHQFQAANNAANVIVPNERPCHNPFPKSRPMCSHLLLPNTNKQTNKQTNKETNEKHIRAQTSSKQNWLTGPKPQGNESDKSGLTGNIELHWRKRNRINREHTEEKQILNK